MTMLLCGQAAKKEREELEAQQAFGPGVQLGLLHGRMTAQEKADALHAFMDGTTPVLIATSVVEVCWLPCASG